MLCLQFSIQDDYYGIDSSEVIEIIPWVKLKHIPESPEFISGCFEYRGTVVPVVDIAALATSRKSLQYLSSRIAVVKYKKHLLGILLENVTETIQLDSKDFQSSGLEDKTGAYLGEIAVTSGKMVQMIRIEELISGPVREIIFTDPKDDIK
jgi:chemotaxis-related protein WspB